jgi:hypothetical protein
VRAGDERVGLEGEYVDVGAALSFGEEAMNETMNERDGLWPFEGPLPVALALMVLFWAGALVGWFGNEWTR